MIISAYLTKKALIQTKDLYADDTFIASVRIVEKYSSRPNVVTKAYERLYKDVELRGFKPSEVTLISE